MSDQNTVPAPAVVEEHQLIAERRDKLSALRAAHAAGSAGVPFPNDF